MRWRALQEGRVYVKQKFSDEQLTVRDIQDMIAKGDKYIADHIMRYGKGLHESRQFWIGRRRELSDMIKQIDSRGLIFFMFSAANFHWPKLHKLIISNENSAQMKGDEQAMDEVAQYIDTLVFTINPKPNALVPERHPCQKGSKELKDDFQDYTELSCRFGYSMDTINHTILHDDEHGRPEVITARNDPLINPYNRLQLQGWRANIDIKPIFSTYATLQYISKYASKAEPQSATFSEILNQILQKSNPDTLSLSSIQKLLLHSVAEHDVSAQETCHLLLEMGPNAVINDSCDLGTRNMDLTHRWVDDAQQRYSDTDLANADTFIHQASSGSYQTNENINVNTGFINPQTLNNNQMKVFKRIESYYCNVLTGCHVEPLKIIILGTAGTGKSYLVNVIRYTLHQMTEIGAKSPTDAAAFNINSITIHLVLSIAINDGNDNLDINGERVKQLQKRLEGAFPEHRNKLFGGRSVIMVGDFGQLPPQFNKIYKLDIVQQQFGDSEEQKRFRYILLRLHDETTYILLKWSDVKVINIDKLRALNVLVAKIIATHSGDRDAKRADSDTAHGLEAQLLLARGAHVMLTANIWTESGLVNSVLGTVQDICSKIIDPLPYLYRFLCPSIITKGLQLPV
ncbi:16503_t:CDS:2 [Cetraspora pellucida]|uniref:16503_t:CDS:1 n=1 Tax=Cetraspora pellucida TaxID=1433469 RepID=A0A9N8VIW9_9GLOM|nr:16503_t:CDS:2 [Cetraspora pellucida]